MKKKLLSAACAVMLSVALTACSGGNALADFTGASNKWVDSDLIGYVPADKEIRPQDDFAASVNQEWKNEVGDEYHGLFQDVQDTVIANKKQIVTDETIEGETAECIRTYYGLASDWDDRAKDGVEPLRPYISDIESINSMDEMYEFFADPARNPLFLAPISTNSSSIIHSDVYVDNYVVGLSQPKLTLTGDQGNLTYFRLDSAEAFEKYEKVNDKAKYILVQLGYSDKDAEKLVKKCVSWEKQIAGIDNATAMAEQKDVTYTRDQVVELAGDFPMEKLLNGWGFGDTQYFMINPEYAKKLKSFCKDRNLDSIKAFLIVNYCLESSIYMDRETYDKMLEFDQNKKVKDPDRGETPEHLEDELMFDKYIGSTSMVGAMNQIYVEKYFDDSTIDELTSITQNMIDGFKDIFSSEEWLSEEGKAACNEKLSAMKIHIAYQDFDTVDYSKLDIKSHEEGGSFLEAYFESRRFDMNHLVWLSQEEYDRDYWDPLNPSMSTTVTNAMYNPTANGIYIFAGILVDPIYSPDMSYEEKLAGLFIVVGHEITHGFDKGGAQYDKEGFKKAFLPVDDQKEFNDRNDSVSAYYTTLTPFSGSGMVLGNNVNAEATADMGGIRVTLYLAEKEEDFDYDAYFRWFARVWRTNVTVEREKDNIKGDVHPLPFYRINVGIQQFDEFYETYDVKEGDGMYLAPDKRIKVW